MDSYFTELGRTVLDRWKEENFSLAKFPGIAEAAMEERPPARHVDTAELIRDFLLHDEQPFQSQSGFGQPELIVYDNPRFYIQTLFWLDGTTDIHQHKFSGAFHVLEGSSLHSKFVFEEPQPISAHLRVGKLRISETQLLETGATVRIVSGQSCIHSLFHLDTPSLTVVVRTHSDPGTGPQFTYLPPHLAVDPFYNDGLTIRRKQLLDVLEKTADPEYPSLVAEMVGSLDFERGFFILQNSMTYLASLGEWEGVWDIFAHRHGPLADYVRPTLEGINRRDAIVAMRSSVADVEHRFFLALLLNVPERETILRLVAQRFPGPPIQTILRWCGELGRADEGGASILDAEFPEVVAAPEDERVELLVESLRCYLEGSDPAVALKPRVAVPEDVEELRKALERSSLRGLLVS
jgi:hypothetical protein